MVINVSVRKRSYGYLYQSSGFSIFVLPIESKIHLN